jgi:hypothetical protein
MLVDTDNKIYRHYFPTSPHPFITESFLELNKRKTDRIVRLIEDREKKEIGLVVGVRNDVLHSPFSAPFGGFHFRNEIIYSSVIDNFIGSLKEYIRSHSLKGIDITLPPDIYHPTFNAKMINSLIRMGFKASIPDITGWVILEDLKETFTQKNSREYFRQAVRNGLSFEVVTDYQDKILVYDLIRENRAKFGRPIFMTLEDIINTGTIWPVDFFRVNDSEQTMVASAIFYRNLPEICYAVFWGDNDTGRKLRSIDFLAFNLWSFYKNLGFKYVDVGISTESGTPNDGLLRFKESHESISSLRYRFTWSAQTD